MLLSVFNRELKNGKFINLTSDEGYSKSHLNLLFLQKENKNCYRIDDEQMNIEITRDDQIFMIF